MSDNDDDRMVTSAHEDDEPEAEDKHDGSSSDDDSSSSSSGSSSSDSDSDSDSDHDDDGQEESSATGNARDDTSYRKYSIESLTSSSTFGSSNGVRSDKVTEEPLNVNTIRAAGRFREEVKTEITALGTKKRDRRTIEEIQRDLQKKRGKPLAPSTSTTASAVKKPAVPVARASPPKSSPVMSPDSGAEMERINLGLAGGLKPGAIKPGMSKASSARSRLEKKLLGRSGGASTSARSSAATKKPSTSSSTAGVGTVTNISAPKITKPAGNSTSSSDPAQAAGESKTMEPKIEAKVVDNSKPDGRVVRSVLRAMLRYGDLTDVNLFPDDHHKSFADEYRLPNFVVRANLESLCKASYDRLLSIACEIADGVKRVLEDQKDAFKFADTEMKPSQVIERLYENLKLRVAVQRALYEIGAPTGKGASAVYALVSKQSDTSVLGIGRDFPAWTWAEKEHDWNNRKDAALLFGIYVHGFGAWEDILNDDRLSMQQQRALKGERLKKRAENLLKRVPPPLNGSAGEPTIVQLANAFISGAQNPGQNLGDKINAIVNGAMVKGGRMQRAADRLASRQAGGTGDSVSEDSIRKSHTQGVASRDRERDVGRERGRDRQREHSRSRDRSREQSRDRSRDRDRDRDRVKHRERDRDRDQERDRDRDRDREGSREPASRKPSITSPSRPPLSRSETNESRERSSSKTSTSKRSASDESTSRTQNGDSETSSRSPKRSKHTENDTASSSRSKASSSSKSSTEPAPSTKRRLSDAECKDKWHPDTKLKTIRQVLKKMKIMTKWSKDQDDEVVVEKVYKYVTTIGEAIDNIVLESSKDSNASADHEWDELGTALWTYAAEFTPFAPTTFERLYDDICADGERFQELERDQQRRRSVSSSS